jgi:hypothetical protein
MALAVQSLRHELRTGDFLMTLNNDTQVTPDTVRCLVEASTAHGRAMVAAATYQDDGQFVAAGARATIGLRLGPSCGVTSDEGVGSFRVADADVLYGRATLVPVEVFDTIGTYDAQRFPQYWGDTDFSLRAKRAGVRQLVALAVAVRFIESAHTTGIHFTPPTGVSLAHARQMLVSPRSNLALLYAARFVWRHGPRGWRGLLVARLCVLNCMIAFGRTRLGAPLRWALEMARAVRSGLTEPAPVTAAECVVFGLDPERLCTDGLLRRCDNGRGYAFVRPPAAWWGPHPEVRRLWVHAWKPWRKLRRSRWSAAQ